MFVATCRLTLRLPASRSLKDKRAVVQSVAARLRHEFGIAVAEVEHQDHHRLTVLGLAAVSNAGQHAREVLEHAVDRVEKLRPDAEIVSADMDVMSS